MGSDRLVSLVGIACVLLVALCVTQVEPVSGVAVAFVGLVVAYRRLVHGIVAALVTAAASLLVPGVAVAILAVVFLVVPTVGVLGLIGVVGIKLGNPPVNGFAGPWYSGGPF
jgi:hypothetical protein